MKNFIKITIIGAGLLTASSIYAHPDGIKPYWYPANYVFGFVEGCWQTIENSKILITQDLWPVQIKSVCGCVVDALRHSLTFAEVQNNFNNSKTQLIVNATLPICVSEEMSRPPDKITKNE